MIVIDTHTHIVPQSFPAPPAGVPPEEWPEMVPLPDGNARMLVGGKEFRVFEPAYWDIEGRLAYMDSEGVTIQVLSPLPELLGYWYQPATTAAIADHMHRTIADLMAKSPTRIAGMGMLPLQDPALAVETVAKAKALGMVGFLVATNINGVSLADARFDPVFQAVEAADMTLFVHGYRPGSTDRMLGGPLMGPIVGVPQEETACIASFIQTDVLARFPGLKLCFVHGGGGFGAVLDRFDHTWGAFPPMQEAQPMAPRDYAKRFFYDTVTFSGDYLAYLVKVFGADRLMAGTDGPTLIGQRDLKRFVTEALGDDTDAIEKILWRNAAAALGLETMTDAHLANA